jgi:hypothetical protein
MKSVRPLDPPREAAVLKLPGLTADNLLALMALLGLLRALEQARPDWRPRARWAGRPWRAELLLEQGASRDDVAATADAGITAIVSAYRFCPVGTNQAWPRDVKFSRDEFRTLVSQMRGDTAGAALVSALAAELPRRDNGSVTPAPLVLLFGQGHQHFLDRLIAVPRLAAASIKGGSHATQPMGPAKLAEALFAEWARSDGTDGFRWDPADDQRYALRFGDPSREGAAKTVHGANRLAAIGLLSFPCVARGRSLTAAGSAQNERERFYVWPIWTAALTLAAVELLLVQDLPALDPPERAAMGIEAVMRARRVSNGKFMNVTWAAEM